MKRKRKIIFLLLVLNLLFIWGKSALPPAASNRLSNGVTAYIGGQTEEEGAAETAAGGHSSGLTSGVVRKLAHGLEFAALGGLTCLYAGARGRRLKEVWSKAALTGMTAALLDETIQRFNGRTSSVTDVWLDCGGFAAGAVLAALVMAAWRRARRT